MTPDGSKRLPFAFSPFLGGKRICLGKTFAEIVAKFVVPALLGRLQFSYVDKEIESGIKEKPPQNLNQDKDPVIMMHVQRASL